jgi:UDP-N-acetylbacillosamine N-acetyltransferase
VRGRLEAAGAVVDHDVEVGSFCHFNAGAIVKAGGQIENLGKLEAGEVVLGYELAVAKQAMKPADSNATFAKEYKEQIGKEVSFF